RPARTRSRRWSGRRGGGRRRSGAWVPRGGMTPPWYTGRGGKFLMGGRSRAPPRRTYSGLVTFARPSQTKHLGHASFPRAAGGARAIGLSCPPPRRPPVRDREERSRRAPRCLDPARGARRRSGRARYGRVSNPGAKLLARRQKAQPAHPREESVSSPARVQPGGLASLGRGRVRRRAPRGQADLSLHRLLHLPLVPRHGARVLRGSGARRVAQRVVRSREGRSRGAPRRRSRVHERGVRHHGRGPRAALGFPPPRGKAVLRRPLLPAASARRAAVLPRGTAWRARGLARPPLTGGGVGRRADAGHRARGALGARLGRPSPRSC